MKPKKQMQGAPLIIGHAENLHANLLDHYLHNFRAMVGRRPGIYVLYNSHKPYYVGLASSLRSRIAKHRSDHLGGRWDRFSLFVIKKEKYLKDVESLLIRVAKTKREGKGNKVTPDFVEHWNMKAQLKRFVAQMEK